MADSIPSPLKRDQILLLIEAIEKSILFVKENVDSTIEDDQLFRIHGIEKVLREILPTYTSCGFGQKALELVKKLQLLPGEGTYSNLRDAVQKTSIFLELHPFNEKAFLKTLEQLSAQEQIRCVSYLLEKDHLFSPQWIDEFLARYFETSIRGRKNLFYEDEYLLCKRVGALDDYFEHLENKNVRFTRSCLLFLAQENARHEQIRDDYLSEAWALTKNEGSSILLGNTGLPSRQSYLYEICTLAIALQSKTLAQSFAHELRTLYPGIHTEYVTQLLGDEKERAELLYALLTPEAMKGFESKQKVIFSKGSLFDSFLHMGAIPLLIQAASAKNIVSLFLMKSKAKMGYHRVTSVVRTLIAQERIEALKEAVSLLEESTEPTKFSIIYEILSELATREHTIQTAQDIAASLTDTQYREMALFSVFNLSMEIGTNHVTEQIALILLDEARDPSSMNRLGYCRAMQCATITKNPIEEFYHQFLTTHPLSNTKEESFRQTRDYLLAASLANNEQSLAKNISEIITQLSVIRIDRADMHGRKLLDSIGLLVSVLPFIKGFRDAALTRGAYNHFTRFSVYK